MQIDEAIKEQQDYLATGYLLGNPKLKNAIQLGIEALKRVNEQHEWGLRHDVIYIALPGETE